MTRGIFYCRKMFCPRKNFLSGKKNVVLSFLTKNPNIYIETLTIFEIFYV